MEQVKRYPRPIRRFPRPMSNADIIENATLGNGVVDLSKIRKMQQERKERQKISRQEMARRMNLSTSLRRQNEMMKLFTEVHKEIIGYDFQPVRKSYWISYRRQGKLIKKKHKSDRARLFKAFADAERKYDCKYEEFKDYLTNILNKISDNSFYNSSRRIFNFVVSEKNIEQFLYSKSYIRKRKRKNDKIRETARKHAEFFSEQG